MGFIADAGFDVFAMDMTGYGWSTRPWPMNDPCNAAPDQQKLLMPSPLSAPCQPSYRFVLSTPTSEWDDVDAVVDYLRTLRGVDRISLVGWSAGGPRAGGYAALHPEKVDKLVLLAPVYSRTTPSAPPAEVPEPGFPLTIGTELGRDGGQVSAAEQACGNSYAAGMNDVVLAVNQQFDPVGAQWGAGIVRAPSVSSWGWNADMAAQVQAPTLLMSGELDTTVPQPGVRDLYADLGAKEKVFVDLACTSHRAQHQAHYRLVQAASLDWLLHGSLEGQTNGAVRKGD